MGRRFLLLLGAICMVHFAVITGKGIITHCIAERDTPTQVQNIVAVNASCKKTVFAAPEPGPLKTKHRTRIWTQFYVFIVPGEQECTVLPAFAEKYKESLNISFAGNNAHNFYSLRGPPAIS